VTYLLEKKQYVSIKELASFFGVSERSIQYDLEKVQYHVSEESGELQRSKKYGVRLIASDALKQSALIKPLEVDYNKHYSPRERQDQILKYLFEGLNPISTNRFSKLLFVSRRTIMEDVREAEKWLHARGLGLAYIQNKGYEITGSEQKFRQAYVEMLANHHNLDSLPDNLTVLTNKEYAIIRQAVNRVLNKLNHHIVQSSIDGLIFHISITIHRIRNGYKINMPDIELEKLEAEPEFQIAREIKEEIEKQFKLTVPEAEIGYITLHLLGAKKASVEVHEDFSEQGLLIRAIDNFVEKISLQLGVDLTNDELLKKGLLIHLRPRFIDYGFICAMRIR
jgi:transcriptional antiterminator